jgi:hypothetical protein
MKLNEEDDVVGIGLSGQNQLFHRHHISGIDRQSDKNE